MVAAGGRKVAGRHHRHTRIDLELDTGGREPDAQPPLPLLCVRTHVLADEDGARVRVERESDGLADDVPATDDERSVPGPQRRVEVAERVEQEHDAVRRSEGEHGVVQDEERHDSLALLDSGGESGVVVQTQITGEQHDDGPVFAHLDKG